MEEVTNYVYRSVYKEMFSGVDKYFTPFISPTQKKVLKTRERKEVDPEINANTYTVPQILTADSSLFNETVDMLVDIGYREFNLNCGCPSGTVVGKKKGSGMLEDTSFLNSFLEDIFSYKDKVHPDACISVKTRIGMYEADELINIMKVYNEYPLSELIVHPRTRQAMYSGKPDMEAFKYAYDVSKCPVCYNGDINTVNDYQRLVESFPNINAVMVGRGLVANPKLAESFKKNSSMSLSDYKAYHDALYEAYVDNYGSVKDALFKMKELWAFMDKGLPHGDNYSRLLKNIKKSKDGEEYLVAVGKMFSENK